MSILLSHTSLLTPIDWLRIEGDDLGITAVKFMSENPGESEEVPAALVHAQEQLEEYFSGKRQHFELSLRPTGTDFQRMVWNALQGIPFGQTQSYGDIASLLKKEKAVRAVGAANGQNPIAVIVPCHRVIGANGQLTGYAGELWRKKWLLAHEASFKYGKQQSLF